MRIFDERANTWHEMEFEGNALHLMKHLGINPQTVLVLKDGALTTEDVDVSDAKEIKLITVVSGG